MSMANYIERKSEPSNMSICHPNLLFFKFEYNCNEYYIKNQTANLTVNNKFHRCLDALLCKCLTSRTIFPIVNRIQILLHFNKEIFFELSPEYSFRYLYHRLCFNFFIKLFVNRCQGF